MKKTLSLLLAAILCVPFVNAAIKVHTIGDSTMADYDENTTDKRGWCMYLGSFFDSQYVTVNNRGKSGADSRQFYLTSNLWPSVKSQMSAGDYLLIQFAHNDEGTITYGMDNLEYKAYLESKGELDKYTDARGTNPQTTFRDYLRTYINEARALGVNPVLVAPICRMYFSGNTIRRNGQHDLGDSFSKLENGVLYEKQSLPASDHSMDYVYAMQVVAQEMNVPFINLTEATKNLYLEYGETQCSELLFCKDDKTHTATLGANLIARLAAQLLKDANVLADYIDIPTSITATPNNLSIGEVYSGVEVSKEVLLTGFGLEPAAGTVNITTSGNLTISTEKEGTYSTSASVSYAGSTLFQKIYIHALYSTSGKTEDKIIITSGNTNIEVVVNASVISLEGGATVQAKWAIDARPIPDAVVEGPISATLTLNHLVATDIKNDISYGGQTIEMVRLHNADDAGAKTNWPLDEIDENAIRYIDFALTAPAAMDVRITNISMLISAYSTGFMCCHINTGFGDDFNDVTTIYERKNIPNASAEEVVLTPMLTIPAGETLHLRVLPWHEHTSQSGKYICLKDVTIDGMAFEPSDDPIDGPVEDSVDNINNAGKVTKLIRDGQVLICKDNHTFTTTGIEVK